MSPTNSFLSRNQLTLVNYCVIGGNVWCKYKVVVRRKKKTPTKPKANFLQKALIFKEHNASFVKLSCRYFGNKVLLHQMQEEQVSSWLMKESEKEARNLYSPKGTGAKCRARRQRQSGLLWWHLSLIILLWYIKIVNIRKSICGF